MLLAVQINDIKLEDNKFILDNHTDHSELKNHVGQIVEIDDSIHINTGTLIKQQHEDEGQVTYYSTGIADIATNSGTATVFYQTKSTNHRDYKIGNRLTVKKLQSVRLDSDDKEKLEKYILYAETYNSMIYLEATDPLGITYLMIAISVIFMIIGLFMMIYNPYASEKQQSINDINRMLYV